MTRRTRVTELMPGIWQIISAGRSAHAYLVRGTRRAVLIDSGLPSAYDELAAGLAEAGVLPADLDLVLLTHEHVDHAGGALRLAKSCPVAAHRLAANKLALRDEFALMNRSFVAEVEAFEVDLLLEDGCRIETGGITLHVLHTPGHCSGCICVLEPARRLLFSADTIMANGIVGGVLNSGNASDYIASLERLAMLKIDYLLPGHGKVSRSPTDDITGGIQRLRGMIDDSHALFSVLRDTAKGYDDIMRSLRDLNVR